MDRGVWSEQSRKSYNLVDAVSRCTVQVTHAATFHSTRAPSSADIHENELRTG